MTRFIKTLGAATAGVLLATTAFAQSAREVRGPSPFVALENEPAPKLVVDPPLSDQLAEGVVQIQYRVENLHIVPVFGVGALTHPHTGWLPHRATKPSIQHVALRNSAISLGQEDIVSRIVKAAAVQISP